MAFHLMPQEYPSLAMGYIAAVPFPWKLRQILEDAEKFGYQHVVSWIPGRNGFKVHDKAVFETQIMPKYFPKTKFKSFQRQLNMWEFGRITFGPYTGGYTHEFFSRSKPELCHMMKRVKIKGTNSKKTCASKMMDHSSNTASSSTDTGAGLSEGTDEGVNPKTLCDAKNFAIASSREHSQSGTSVPSHVSFDNSTAEQKSMRQTQSSSTSSSLLDYQLDLEPTPLREGGEMVSFEGKSFLFVSDETHASRRSSLDTAPRYLSAKLFPSMVVKRGGVGRSLTVESIMESLFSPEEQVGDYFTSQAPVAKRVSES
mmetsp:Transcript_24112/g.42788  ORF Transcript_24112/g.42788 Transcript_24112/m.42788 type:complete len:313 (-) Transcript_24112:1017-1955(-)